MRTRIAHSLLAALAAAAVIAAAKPAAAWGAKAEAAIVNTALHLLARDANLAIDRFEREVRDGAALSDAQLRELIPGMAAGPLRAVADEMALLQAVRGDRIDAYYAFRLGALGGVAAQALAPMGTAGAAQRNLYYTDVEKNLPRVDMRPGERRTVDVNAYLPPLIAAATASDAAIAKDYERGIGFDGLASLQFPQDINRAVAAVADLWFTVLGAKAGAPTAEGLRRDYVLRAMRFYIERGNTAEMDAMAARLESAAPFTPEMRVAIGDYYYEAGLAGRAVKEYEAVLAAEPDRREVAGRIAAYYVALGKTALDEGRLEAARDEFAKAAGADPLDPDAERMRLDTESLIAARDARLAAAQAQLQQADGLMAEAAGEALDGRFAEAIALARQAGEAYTAIEDEFASEAAARDRGLRDVAFRTQEYRTALMENVQNFSGIGAEADLRALAAHTGRTLDRQTLENLVRAAHIEAQAAFAQSRAAALAVQ